MNDRPKSVACGACLVVVPDGASDLTRALTHAGFAVTTALAERDALEALERSSFEAVYVAQSLGGPALARVVAASGQRLGDAPVVVLGSAGTVQEAVDAMQLGAGDYLAPPHDPEAAVRRLARILERCAPPSTVPFAPSLLGVVGSSPAMRRLYASIEKISRYKSNVLLLGESGTGKEIIARALHERGPRRQHLFVPVNCATLGRDILENELFGHERGAFTGANERKKGLFELADGGTFLLDEIAEMDLSTQAKLLRVLERSEFRRVGGTAKVKVDLSIVAATNRNLEEAIAAGRFREDLYYRLKVVTLVVPPLRERREDIPALVEAFVADFNRRTGGRIAGVEPAALEALVQRDWPGNVRELRNAVEGACVLAMGDTVKLEDLGEPDARGAPPLPALPRAPARAAPLPEPTPIGGHISIPIGCSLAEAERRIILANLAHYGTRARAARALGVGLRTLYTKLAAWSRDGEDAESA
ncbi:sigma-54 dependent transcriptional regulator [Anaeromyxobacter sp. Fw109-5]|uniref:sigma-54-dependent transcriptional regulator n=1 Tax=Anaeromyxobacter sp. (strain Fw109-5) TaxID=404589 RepID=UPI000158A85C|nr:sigma-54 dependent transcriptional regulator [Anaeromyxobacter sp. Fw109-5]ABS27956.1 two component, sigma54 specific, transcriptional regulator, Fis family [Anaeromyxobacter sp. Fw109-5]